MLRLIRWYLRSARSQVFEETYHFRGERTFAFVFYYLFIPFETVIVAVLLIGLVAAIIGG